MDLETIKALFWELNRDQRETQWARQRKHIESCTGELEDFPCRSCGHVEQLPADYAENIGRNYYCFKCNNCYFIASRRGYLMIHTRMGNEDLWKIIGDIHVVNQNLRPFETKQCHAEVQNGTQEEEE